WVAALFAAGLVATRPRPRPRHGRAAVGAWATLAALVAALAGLTVGSLRIAAIDRGAFDGPPGSRVSVHGFVTSVPRRSGGVVSVKVQTADGRLALEAPEPVPDLPIGREVAAAGTVKLPAPWQTGYLERYGIRKVIAARRLRL